MRDIIKTIFLSSTVMKIRTVPLPIRKQIEISISNLLILRIEITRCQYPKYKGNRTIKNTNAIIFLISIYKIGMLLIEVLQSCFLSDLSNLSHIYDRQVIENFRCHKQYLKDVFHLLMCMNQMNMILQTVLP